MRTLTNEQTRVLTGGSSGAYSRSVYTKVELAPTVGGAYVNISSLNGFDFVRGVKLSHSVDNTSQTCELTLARKIFDYATSPLVVGSALNVGSTLLNLNYSVRISTAVVPSGVVAATSDYVQVFLGRVYQFNMAGENDISVSCHDYVGELLSLWTYPTASARVYGSNASPTAIETVMQSILSDTYFATGSLQPYLHSLYTPVSPSASTVAMTAPLGAMPLYTALQNFSQQCGWLLQQKWDSGTSAWRLTLYDPLRSNTTSTWTFPASQYFDITECGLHLAEIRNYIVVAWTDINGAANSNTLRDNTSIGLYGSQFMMLAQEATQGIYTTTDADNLLNRAMSDLSSPQITVSLKVPYFWPIELCDIYTISANGEHFDTDQNLAVVSYEHDLPNDGMETTTINFRGKPSGGVMTWFAKQQSFLQKKFGIYNTSVDTVDRYPNSTFSQYTRF